MSWGDQARAAIGQVHRQLPDDAPLKARIAAVDAAYPFGERAYWPLKAWHKARRAYLVRFGYIPRRQKLAGENSSFFGWERDPETGRPIIP